MTMGPELAVVIPTPNEKDNVAPLIKLLDPVLDGAPRCAARQLGSFHRAFTLLDPLAPLCREHGLTVL